MNIGLFLIGYDKSKVIAPPEDPTNLKAAIIFGVLYLAVLFAVAAVKVHFSDKGLFVVAALSGLADMDAITPTAANLIKSGRLDLDTGCRMILIGVLSNLVFKAGIAGIPGSRRLFKRICLAFGISIAGGVLLLFWPKIG